MSLSFVRLALKERCERVFCKEVCSYHFEIAGCAKTSLAPWVCNGCRKLSYGCNRSGRYRYSAAVADKTAKDRCSTSRCGINKTTEEFDQVLGIIRPALARRLSPYEIATLYADTLHVSVSTLYRWIERGYGGMANIELERKVGFNPRRQQVDRRHTHHGRARSYEAFCKLSEEEQAGCCEMDTVIGKKSDTKCLLTLYIRPAHFQLFVLLEEKTTSEVVGVFDTLEQVSRHLFLDLFSVILTDNGAEFADPAALERSVHKSFPKRCRVYYCDPRKSQQKGRCEKNHSELR